MTAFLAAIFIIIAVAIFAAIWNSGKHDGPIDWND